MVRQDEWCGDGSPSTDSHYGRHERDRRAKPTRVRPGEQVIGGTTQAAADAWRTAAVGAPTPSSPEWSASLSKREAQSRKHSFPTGSPSCSRCVGYRGTNRSQMANRRGDNDVPISAARRTCRRLDALGLATDHDDGGLGRGSSGIFRRATNRWATRAVDTVVFGKTGT